MKENKQALKEWLDSLQMESWQLELVISGIALLGIFQAKGSIDAFGEYLQVNQFSGILSRLFIIFYSLLKGSWYIFVINLVGHIIMRGLWIGAVGLRYVSKDVDYDALKFSDYFRKHFSKRYESFDDYIEGLESLCSIIFAWTFLLFFLTLSGSLAFFWPSLLEVLFGEVGVFIGIIFILIGIVILIDFILLSPLKKVGDRQFSKIYGAIFRFYALMTLSFLYRPLLLNFLDTRFTRRLFLFSFPYGILIVFFLPGIQTNSMAYFPHWGQTSAKSTAYNAVSFNPYLYENISDPDRDKIDHIRLSSNLVESNVLSFFYVLHKRDQDYLKEGLQLDPLRKTGVSFNSIFRSGNRDSSMTVLEKEIAQEVAALNARMREDTTMLDSLWREERTMIDLDYKLAMFNYYKDKLSTVKDSVLSLSQFYIDDREVSDQLDCMYSQHPNMGEKGWNCYCDIGNLDNGLHQLKVLRKLYDDSSNSFRYIILEIPFIVDRKSN